MWIPKEKLVWPRVLGNGVHQTASPLSFPVGICGQVQIEARVQVVVHLEALFPKG